MARALAENRLSREIKKLTHPKLLVIDEVGYLSLEPAHASLLFQALCERYQKQPSVILTSNQASAALDRLLHCSTVIHLRSDRFRLKEKRQANAALDQEAPHR